MFYPMLQNVVLMCCVLCSVGVYSEEEGVGFEDHVLLNHLLKGFPSRGALISYFVTEANAIGE